MQINNRKILILMTCSLLIATSCKKNIPAPVFSKTTPTNFNQVFDEFWNGMSTNYLYWDMDTTNWDKMYRQYKPLFAQLNLQDKTDLVKSVSYFRHMTDGLIDSHYSINFKVPELVDSFLFPALSRKEKNTNFHSPFLFISVDSNYLDQGFLSGKYVASDNTEISALCGTIKKKILYFYCNAFALSEAYYSSTDNGIKATLQYFFNQLHDLPSNIKGLIIDVRNNKGGNLTDLNFLVGRLIDKPILYGYTRYKSGNGRLAYTPWINAIINPQAGAKAITVTLIVLADNYTASVAEAITMAIRTLPKSIFIGEITWGATEPITKNIVYNDRPFQIPNFLSVYTASAVFKYKDGISYEGQGFLPDIFVPFNLNELNKGKDPQLNKSISLIP